MLFESCKSILYSDTLVPDIFISEYMPSMDSDCVKIYLHCLFLSKYNKYTSAKELSKKLSIDVDKVKTSLTYLESVGIIARKDNSDSVVLNDLKEKEISKVYRMKATSTPEEAILSSERNKKRNEIIKAINNKFFQGLMPISWYTDIDAWFDRFKFEEDVMYALFAYCYNLKGLNKNYILKVAEAWYSRNIKNSFDLDNYSIEEKRFKDVRGKVVKKLKLGRNLTEYEEEHLEKWVITYKFDFEIIELALKKTTGISNPSFQYIGKIIDDWYEKGLRTKEDVIAYERDNKKSPTTKKQTKAPAARQLGNFEQRKHDDEYYDSLYENV